MHSTCKHGAAKRGGVTRTYVIWLQMRKRCKNPKQACYARYGGRGISVCPEWDDYAVFLADMGEAPPRLTLERKDNDGNYCKSNCKWATQSEQNKNSSQSTKYTYEGETLCACDWESRLGLKQGAIWHRLKGGWSLDKALSTPSLLKRASERSK